MLSSHTNEEKTPPIEFAQYLFSLSEGYSKVENSMAHLYSSLTKPSFLNLCSIACNLGFIRQSESYIPEKEFQDLIKLDVKNYQTQFTVSIIYLTLYISDLIIQRKGWKEDSSEVKSHLDLLDHKHNQIYMLFLDIPWNRFNSSITIRYLLNRKTAYQFHQRKTSIDMSGLIASIYGTDHTTQEIKNALSAFSNPTTDRNQETSAIKTLSTLYFNYGISKELYRAFIESALIDKQEYQGKIDFLKTALVELQAGMLEIEKFSYSYSQKFSDLSRILYDFFEIANKHIPIHELSRIMKDINFQISHNQDKSRGGYYANFYVYWITIISLIKDEVTPITALEHVIPHLDQTIIFLFQIIGEKIQNIRVNHLNTQEDFISRLPLLPLARYQGVIKQFSQLFIEKKTDPEKILAGLDLLKLDDRHVEFLCAYFRKIPNEKTIFEKCICQLSLLSESSIEPKKIREVISQQIEPAKDKLLSFDGNVDKKICAFIKILRSIGRCTELIHYVPQLLMPHIIKDSSVVDSFIELEKKYKLCTDDHSEKDDDCESDITCFLLEYEDKIKMLIDLMGKQGTDYLQKQLVGTSLLPIKRFLDLLPSLDVVFIEALAPYFKVQDKKDIPNLINCIIAINTYYVINKSLEHSVTPRDILDVFVLPCDQIKPEAFLFELIKSTLLIVFKDRRETLIQMFMKDENAILKHLSLEELTHLLLASIKMKESEYYPFYINLLWNDLIGVSNNSFLHDINHDDPIGVQVRLHNQAIKKCLLKHKIDPIKAIASSNQTQKFLDLIICPENENPTDHQQSRVRINQIVTLWGYLLKVEESLQESSEIVEIINIKKHIQELKSKIQKSQKREGDDIVDVLSSNADIISKLNNIFDSLKRKNITPNRQFIEFSEHFMSHLKTFSLKQKVSDKNPKHTNAKFIRVLQWDKSNNKTFRLGDDVSCCLATTGTRFDAMVQRRLDDAMIFFVAMDQSQKEPIGLIWAYLAETKDKKIVLMANFFEVRASIGIHDHLRLSVLYGLLKFVEGYLKDNPNIQGFYMNKLRYGLNADDLDSYPIIKVLLHDKLCGAILMEDPYSCARKAGKEKTIEHYYLASLEEKNFHVFDSDILSKERPKQVILVTELIADFIAKYKAEATNVVTVDHATQALLAAHGADLLLFYTPSDQYNSLKALVAKELAKSHVCTHQSDDKSTMATKLGKYGVFTTEPVTTIHSQAEEKSPRPGIG